jgi:hypothetical protein
VQEHRGDEEDFRERMVQEELPGVGGLPDRESR